MFKAIPGIRVGGGGGEKIENNCFEDLVSLGHFAVLGST